MTRRLLAETTTPSGSSSSARTAQPDWDQLQNILGSGAAPQDRSDSDHDDLEYFPGRPAGPEGSSDELISSIPETIPVEVMSGLLRIFFQTIHPVWPIIHIPTFFADLCRWDDHAFAALVVSMCMIASRYSTDPRVRSDPSESREYSRGHSMHRTTADEADNATSAGAHYYDLFNVLRHAADGGRGVRSENVVYMVMSLFFASLFHCVDNVPHPAAHGLFAAAYSRVLDAGLHRLVPPGVGDSITREARAVSLPVFSRADT